MVTSKVSRSLLLVVLLFSLSGVTTVFASPEKCSQATLKGTYGFYEEGTIVEAFPGFPPPPVPFATAGMITYDGKGKLSGKDTTNMNGWGGAPDTFTGTYTVNPDCTYSDVFTTSSGLSFHDAGTITGFGRLQEVDSIDTDAGVVAFGTVKKAPQGRCSVAMLKGRYGLFEQGTILEPIYGFPPPPLPFATAGIITYDGKGKLSGKDTTSLDGVTAPDTFTGTYTVNPDCTYSDEFTSSSGLTYHDTGTITGSWILPEVHAIDSDPGVVALGTVMKQ
jgi:hypothetical protein